MNEIDKYRAFEAGREQSRREYCRVYVGDVYRNIQKEITEGRTVKVKKSSISNHAYSHAEIMEIIVRDINNSDVFQTAENPYYITCNKTLFSYVITIHLK